MAGVAGSANFEHLGDAAGLSLNVPPVDTRYLTWASTLVPEAPRKHPGIQGFCGNPLYPWCLSVLVSDFGAGYCVDSRGWWVVAGGEL